MKILVTGASGFIGGHLIDRLHAGGQKVRALFTKRGYAFAKGIEAWEGDLTKPSTLDGITKGIDVVFHLGAVARPSPVPEQRYFDVNVQGTRNLLTECTHNPVHKILIMSSVAAVGPSPDGRRLNESSTCDPKDTYGLSKRAQEQAAYEFFAKHHLPVIILRSPTVYGPRDPEIGKLVRAVSAGIFPIRSNKKVIEYIYVENLVDACLLLMKSGKSGETYHVSDGVHYSLNEVLESISLAAQKKLVPLYVPKGVFEFSGFVLEKFGKVFRFQPPFKRDTAKWMTEPYWNSDISKIKALGYQPSVSLKEGMKRTVGAA